MKQTLVCAAILAVAAAAVQADTTTWQGCRAIADAGQRLACYDALVDASQRQPAPATTTAPVPASAANLSRSPAVATSAVAASVDVAPVSATPVTATPVTATPVTASADAPAPMARQTPAEFGLERKAVESQLEKIESRIPGEFRGWQAKDKITLANGQVWQVVDGSRGTYQLDNPAVTVERGLFGAFFLRIDGANKAPKVKRIK